MKPMPQGTAASRSILVEKRSVLLPKPAPRSARLSPKQETKFRQALDEARGEVHQAFDELRVSLNSDDEQSSPVPPVPPLSPEASEEAEGLPVPIVPGTRVTEASASPPTPRRQGTKAASSAVLARSSKSTVTGRLSATGERAVADARHILRDNVADWLEPEVPRSWAVSERMLDAMVVEKPHVKSIEKSYGEVFEATLTVDKSPQRRTSLIAVYNRQLVERRLAGLGACAGIYLDLPGRDFRLHSRRRGDQGLLHQSIEDAGRCRCGRIGGNPLSHDRLTVPRTEGSIHIHAGHAASVDAQGTYRQQGYPAGRR